MQLLRKILWSFMLIIFALFPSFTLPLQQQLANSTDEWAPRIIEAVENEDVEAMKDMMCLNIRTNIDDLDGKIQQFFDCFEGEIIESSWKGGLGSWSARNENGDQIAQSAFAVYITTTVHRYTIAVTWEHINTINPEEMRIRMLHLATEDFNGEYIFALKATEGICSWHE